MIDSMKRASAGRINVVMPYYGYARQDRKAKARDPITSKLVANLIQTAGADRILTFDLHAAQIQGYFDIPIDDLTAVPMIGQYFKKKKVDRINSGPFLLNMPRPFFSGIEYFFHFFHFF